MRSLTKPLFLAAVLLCGALCVRAEEVLQEWTFSTSDRAEGWEVLGLTKPEVIDGALCATFKSSDPILLSPEFSFIPKKGQYVEIRARCVSSGAGTVYFASDKSGPYGGFYGKQAKSWNLLSDGRTHTYRVYPAWDHLPQIIRIRLDFGTPITDQLGRDGFAIESVRIIDPQIESLPASSGVWNFDAEELPWYPEAGRIEPSKDGWLLDGTEGECRLASAPFHLPAGQDLPWLNLTLKTDAPSVQIGFAGDRTAGEVSFSMPLEPSEESAVCSFRIGARNDWGTSIYFLSLTLRQGGKMTLERIELSDRPLGPARLAIRELLSTEAVNRVGSACPVELRVMNIGGAKAANLRACFDLPDGVTLDQPGDDGSVPLGDAEPFQMISHTFALRAEKPFDGTISCTVTGEETRSVTKSFDLKVTPSLDLPKAEYVPEPRPIELEDPELEIGAIYFPGWPIMKKWDPIKNIDPIRKPVLGWYQEGLPEVVDWQIKWARECGISFFLVDWYWNKGNMYLDHWVKAFQKAQYKGQFKWAMMWANHNGPGSHSIEDQRAVTKFWIENYFNTPEYYTIDGKPVVMIWTPAGMDDDVVMTERAKGNTLSRGQGVKTLLDESRRLAIEAGYPGIYFIAMCWPEASTNPSDIQWLKDGGFDCTSQYRYMSPGEGGGDSYSFDFDKVVDSAIVWDQKRLQTGILPFLPNLTSGWDDRPWNNHLVIANRTVEKFRRLCENLKGYLAESGQKRIVIGPINEWGEGSYIEPNREFGFGMYEALRETFGKEPEGGWPQYYAPADVGLGPYDCPAEE